MTSRLRANRLDDGFTLIELLIVVLILAILAAIVIFAVGTSSSDSITASCRSDAKSAATALEAFKTANPQVNRTVAGYTAGVLAVGDFTTTTPWLELTIAGGTTGASGLTWSAAALPKTGPWMRAMPDSARYTIGWAKTGVVYVASKSTTLTVLAGNTATPGTWVAFDGPLPPTGSNLACVVKAS